MNNEILCPICGNYVDISEIRNEIRNETIDEIYDILYKEYYDGFRGEPGSKQRLVDYILAGFFLKLKEMKK